MIQVIVLTDGDHEAFAESISSFRKNLKTTYRLEWVTFCKKDDGEFRDWAMQNFPWLTDVRCTRFQMREAWDTINPNADYVLEFSDQYELVDELDLDAAIGLIDEHPHLAQLSLARERLNGEKLEDSSGRKWTEHDLQWTVSPSIYRTAITDMGWPIGRSPVDRMTTKLNRNSKSWKCASLEVDPVVLRNA